MEKLRDVSPSSVGDLPDIGAGYETLRLVGEGGMGRIYLVRQIATQKLFAAKLLRSEFAAEEGAVKRFEQEVIAASNLEHPNTVPVYGYGKTVNAIPYLIMDYVEGQNLGQIIENLGPMDLERALNIFEQVLDALVHAHSKGIVHRDLKPSNVLISNRNGVEVAQLVDFGISKLQMRYGETLTSLTQTGAVFGSPRYMSPEQCEGEEIDQRSDIYSLGCVFFEVLSGAPPYSGANPFKVMTKHVSDPIPELRREDLPDYLKQIITTCLEKKPHKRYQNVIQLSRDIRNRRASRRPKRIVPPGKRGTTIFDRLSRHRKSFLILGALNVMAAFCLVTFCITNPESLVSVLSHCLSFSIKPNSKIVIDKPNIAPPVVPPLQTLPPARPLSLVTAPSESERNKFREIVGRLKTYSRGDSVEQSQLDRAFKEIKASYGERTVPVLLAMTKDSNYSATQYATLFLRDHSALNDRVNYLSLIWSHQLAASMTEADIVPFSRLVLSANPEIAEHAIQELARFTLAGLVGRPHRRVQIPSQLCDSLLWYMLNSKNGYTRERAAVSLAEFSSDRRVSQALTYIALNDTYGGARREAGMALVRSYFNGDCSYAHDALRYMFLNEPEDTVIAPMLYLVMKGQSRERIAEFVPVFKAIIETRAEHVRMQVVSIFEMLGPEATSATPELIRALMSERLRPDAIIALAHVNAKPAVPVLIAIQRSDKRNAQLADMAVKHLEGKRLDNYSELYLRLNEYAKR